jgi:seryl-tRNA synthetase
MSEDLQSIVDEQTADSAPTEGVSMETLRALIKLDEEVKSLEEEIKGLRADRERLQKEVLEQFAANGVDNMRVDGRTVYRSLTVRASVPAENREQVCDALKAIGLGQLVSVGVNAQTLSAQVREWCDESAGGLGVPAEIAGLISVYEDRKVSVRR